MRHPIAPPVPMPPGIAAPTAPDFQAWSGLPRRPPMGVPVGTVVAFAGQVAPETAPKFAGHQRADLRHSGWLPCDGTALKIIAFPDLFTVLGTLYGAGDGGGHQFNLPNYQGYFLRATDLADPATDPDRTQRTPPKGADGGLWTGIGSTQSSALQQHTHDIDHSNSDIIPGQNGTQPATTPGSGKTGKITKDANVPTSRKETRALNVYVYWLIKSRPDAQL